MQFIEHIPHLQRLILVWQKPGGGRLFSVGELREHGNVVTFRYLVDSDDYHEAIEGGFSGYPAFPVGVTEYNDRVMGTFMRRLPPRSRGDFSKYLEQWRLPPEAFFSDFALLAYSGAKLPTDNFSIVWPLDEITAPGEVLLEVAGFRYQDTELGSLTLDGSIEFVPEPENVNDCNALRIEFQGKRIGFVKRAQCATVRIWLAKYNVVAHIERFNGTTERPIIYVFCRLTDRRSSPLSTLTIRLPDHKAPAGCNQNGSETCRA